MPPLQISVIGIDAKRTWNHSGHEKLCFDCMTVVWPHSSSVTPLQMRMGSIKTAHCVSLWVAKTSRLNRWSNIFQMKLRNIPTSDCICQFSYGAMQALVHSPPDNLLNKISIISIIIIINDIIQNIPVTVMLSGDSLFWLPFLGYPLGLVHYSLGCILISVVIAALFVCSFCCRYFVIALVLAVDVIVAINYFFAFPTFQSFLWMLLLNMFTKRNSVLVLLLCGWMVQLFMWNNCQLPTEQT